MHSTGVSGGSQVEMSDNNRNNLMIKELRSLDITWSKSPVTRYEVLFINYMIIKYIHWGLTLYDWWFPFNATEFGFEFLMALHQTWMNNSMIHCPTPYRISYRCRSETIVIMANRYCRWSTGCPLHGRVRKLFHCLIRIKEPFVRKSEGLKYSKILGILQTV